MPRKGVEGLEILEGGVQKARKVRVFYEKKNIIGQERVRYGIICAFSRRSAAVVF